MRNYGIILCVMALLSASAMAASEHAFLALSNNGVRWLDKSGMRTDGGKADLFAELSGEDAKLAKAEQAQVLILNGLSKKGWEVVSVNNTPGEQVYLLRRDAGAAPRGGAATPGATTTPPARGQAADETRVPLAITGGHETDQRDNGRPVVLVAAGLGVAPEVFRDAFSHVTPSRNGPPDRELAQKNKEALMSALGKYGITNDRLDEVSNYYRYHRPEQDLWKHRDASGYATVKDGVVTSVTITDAGAGYSSAPTVTVPGTKQTLTATVWFGTDLEKNGSIKEVAVGK